MIQSIELQMISKIQTSEDEDEVNTLCQFDTSYYSVYKEQIGFILDHKDKYGNVPDVFTFQAQFVNDDITLVDVNEPIEFLVAGIKKNKQYIIFVETFNKVQDLTQGDISEAWEYIGSQYENALKLSDVNPMNIVKQAEVRANTVVEFSKQTRIPTGFPEIDKLMYGGFSTVEELFLIVARTNTGKAQPLWSKVLTPTGWTTMGDLKLGDLVIGENNDVGRVVKLFPQGVKDYYRVNFDDGTSVECCDDHLWKVLDSKRRQRADEHYGEHEILMLKDIRANLSNNYTVDITDPVEFDVLFDESQELDGYLLGVILGDGGLRDGRVTISNESAEIWARIEDIITKYGCHRSGKQLNAIKGVKHGENFVREKIIEYGLLNKKSIDKFIPKQYLTAPIHVRKALLAGLVDTDGYISKDNKQVWEFDTSSEQLAKDFAALARSLGVKVKVHSRQDSYYVNSEGHQVKASGSRHLVCRSVFNPFWYSKKSNRFCVRTVPYKRSMPKRHCKSIKSVEYVGKTECQCILLDNKTHTYITDGYTVTHNSWIVTRMAEAAQRSGFPVAIYSPEMRAEYLSTRFDSWRGHFKNSDLFLGRYSQEYWDYIYSLQNESTDAFIIEDKDMLDGVTARSLGAFVKQHGIKLLLVDGLSYMQDSRRSSRDYEKYKHICEDLFMVSKKYGCAVVVTAQANRETKDTLDDKGEPFPSLYQVSDSDAPARIATQAIAVRQIFDQHVLDIRLEKSRNAKNERPVLSYSWDVNTGNMQYIPSDADMTSTDFSVTSVSSDQILNNVTTPDTSGINIDDLEDEDVEF